MSVTLDDLRAAAGGSDLGVNLIPFADLRRDATSASEEVKRKKSEAEIDTNTLKNQKESKLYDIKQLKEKIANEEKVEASLRRQDDIDKWKKEIEEHNAKIKEINEKMTSGLEALDKLAEARAKLREYFDKAKSQLSDLKSNPERALGSNPSDEDKKKLEEYVRVILGEIEDEEKGHRQAEDELKTSREKMKEVLAKTE
jgi:chromosome segregation ATPase